mgnify:CR=1 FL=1
MSVAGEYSIADWLASVTGRLGYTWGPGLIYAKGGVAFRDDSGLTGTGGFVGSVTDRKETGYTVGGGLEYLFTQNWSGKIEYQYYDFGNVTAFDPAGVALGSFRKSFRKADTFSTLLTRRDRDRAAALTWVEGI